MGNRYYSTIAECSLYSIYIDEDKYILMSDNGGESGAVYETTHTIGKQPSLDSTFAAYFEGEVRRHGQALGDVVIVDTNPLPDSALKGFSALKKNRKAVYRYYDDTN